MKREVSKAPMQFISEHIKLIMLKNESNLTSNLLIRFHHVVIFLCPFPMNIQEFGNKDF